jgi:hypothetical protein
MLRSIGLPELLVMCVFVSFFVIPFWKISEKAGYPAIAGFFMLIPFLNILLLFFFAFSEWPVLQELRALRLRAADQTGKYSGTL